MLARMKGNALYFPADLHQGDATYKADITAIPFEDAFFDVVICHHVPATTES